MRLSKKEAKERERERVTNSYLSGVGGAIDVKVALSHQNAPEAQKMHI